MAGPLEKDTCRDYVVPHLEASGWAGRVLEQYPVTDGKIVPVPRREPRGRDHRRDRPLRADYLLEIQPGVPVAVVEAKREYKLPGDGLQQAMRYAQMLDLPFAYGTNGKGIVEHDHDTGIERDLAAFPDPDELWRRYRKWKGIVDDTAADTLLLPFNRDLRLPDGRVKEPRYYQQVAIERALHAVLSERRNRILLTLATGTGKTFPCPPDHLEALVERQAETASRGSSTWRTATSSSISRSPGSSGRCSATPCGRFAARRRPGERSTSLSTRRSPTAARHSAYFGLSA